MHILYIFIYIYIYIYSEMSCQSRKLTFMTVYIFIHMKIKHLTNSNINVFMKHSDNHTLAHWGIRTDGFQKSLTHPFLYNIGYKLTAFIVTLVETCFIK